MRSHRYKYVSGIPVTWTSQITNLLVLTISTEYFLILAGLAWSNAIADFTAVRQFSFRLKGYVSPQYGRLGKEWAY